MKRIPKYTIVQSVIDPDLGCLNVENPFYVTRDILPTKEKAKASLRELRVDNLGRHFEIKKEWVNKKKRSWRKN